MAAGSAAMVTPAGRSSVNARSIAGFVLFELSMVNTRVDVLPGPIVPGPKALLKTGGGFWADNPTPKKKTNTATRAVLMFNKEVATSKERIVLCMIIFFGLAKYPPVRSD